MGSSTKSRIKKPDVRRRTGNPPDAALVRLAAAERPEEVYTALLEAAVALGFPRGLVLEADLEKGRFDPVAELRWPGAGLKAFRGALAAPRHEAAGLLRALRPSRLAHSSLHDRPVCFLPMFYMERDLCGAAGCLFAGLEAQSGGLELQRQLCGVCGIRGFAAAVVMELPAASPARASKDLTSLVQAANRQLSRMHWISHARLRLREIARLQKAGSELERNMLEIEKFAATGRLAATIAHEVNNPMDAIKNAIYMLSNSMTDSAMPYFNILKSETERVSRIVRQMLGLYRNAQQVRPVNINTIIAETAEVFAGPLQQANIKVRSQMGKVPDTVIAADQIGQVLSNLILNARDAMPEGGRLWIRSRHLPSHGEDHGWVRVLIADTGTGIPRELIPSIFDPFITTKGEKGTGLGLWIVKGIIQSHAGRLSVKSRLGRGTVFMVELPVGKL
jgi:signal transduction histidine kinase